MRIQHSSGYSLTELAAVVCLLLILCAIAAPPILASLDDSRAAAAARYITARLHEARMEAVQRSANVAIRFTPSSGGYDFAVYVDGNSNGVLTRDIEQGIDRQVRGAERLTDRFRDVEFGTLPGLPSPEPDGAAPGADPIKLGSSNALAFSALGTSSSGSLYIKSRGGAQFVVRVFGDTGKVRILRFDARAGEWAPL
jgi:type II secretory pathway pseudopilin PulG